MVTYSQPIISNSGKFLGIATIDVTVDALCYGDQCNEPVNYNYLTNIRGVGLTFCAIAMVLALGSGVWTQVHRMHRVVIASQPFFLRIICIGCLIMASSIIPLSIDDSVASPEGCSKACMAFPWVSFLHSLHICLLQPNQCTYIMYNSFYLSVSRPHLLPCSPKLGD